MFKKLLVAVVALSLLFAPVAIAAENDVTTGIYSSYKEVLEVQWVEYKGDRTEFVMIQDDVRVGERLRNSGSPMAMIIGYSNGAGSYYVVMQTPFRMFPIGIMSWDTIITEISAWRVLENHPPTVFQTVMDFEDIWAYFEYDDVEPIKELVRALNAADLETYEGDM